ncbi:MAG: hypothetical protein AAF514_23150, partial [Verrucomicrobiota bacterium]
MSSRRSSAKKSHTPQPSPEPPEDGDLDLEREIDQWEEEIRLNETKADGEQKEEERRRLSGMLRTSGGGEVREVGGQYSFACPACGQILGIRKRHFGKTVECGQCKEAIVAPDPENKVPAKVANGPGLGPSKPRVPKKRAAPTSGQIPEKKSSHFRTADDLRINRDGEENPGTELEAALRKELEAISKRLDTEQPAPASEPAESKPQRLVLRKDVEKAPLPELVSLESMELDSEVYDQWGPQAMVNTKRLHRLAFLGLLLVLGGVGWFIYDQVYSEKGEGELSPDLVEERAVERAAVERVAISKKAIKDAQETLKGFLSAKSAGKRAEYIRGGTRNSLLISEYLGRNPDVRDRRVFKYLPKDEGSEDVFWEWKVFENKEFLNLRGSFQDQSSFSAYFEETADGMLLDWKSFAGVGDMDWNEFVSQRPETSHEMRAQAIPERISVDLPGYSEFTINLRPYGVGPTVWGYMKEDSQAYVALKRFFGKRNPIPAGSGEIVRGLADPYRVLLKLRFDPDAPPDQVLIEELVADHWIE